MLLLLLFLGIVSEVVVGRETEIGEGVGAVTEMTDTEDTDPGHPSHVTKIKMKSK